MVYAEKCFFDYLYAIIYHFKTKTVSSTIRHEYLYIFKVIQLTRHAKKSIAIFPFMLASHIVFCAYLVSNYGAISAIYQGRKKDDAFVETGFQLHSFQSTLFFSFLFSRLFLLLITFRPDVIAPRQEDQSTLMT